MHIAYGNKRICGKSQLSQSPFVANCNPGSGFWRTSQCEGTIICFISEPWSICIKICGFGGAMYNLDSTFCYFIFVWYLLLASLFLLHIAVQNIQVLMHTASLERLFWRTSQLEMGDFVANCSCVNLVLMHIAVALKGVCCMSQFKMNKQVR